MNALVLIVISLPFFFYKLGQSSLVSWDEAWYAEIAKNINKTGNLFELYFNGSKYYDHPPFGFWMIALSQKIFGINEFGARAASAIFAIIAVIFLYLLGKEFFSKKVGFFSALALSSAPWFVYRARSGNLDIFLTALFVVTIYLAFKVANNKKYLLVFSLSLAFLFLTKTMVPFTIIPALIIIFFRSSLFGKKKVIII